MKKPPNPFEILDDVSVQSVLEDADEALLLGKIERGSPGNPFEILDDPTVRAWLKQNIN